LGNSAGCFAIRVKAGHFISEELAMKRMALRLAVAGLVAGMCGAGFAQQDSTKSADKSFIKDASEGSLAEVNFARR
jgi:hypothetical protein